MSRRPTIKDVAREAGVSKSTVSLVLQNNPAVKAETRSRVQAAMARIGYVYNRAAATLRSESTGLIGLVINDLRNPFFAEFATSLQMALSAGGYAAVVANTDNDAALQTHVVEAMIQHGVDALVLSPAYGPRQQESFDVIARAGIPAMQVLRRVHDDRALFPFIAPDYRAGSSLATRHLLESGAARIAFVGGLDSQPVARERMSGYLSGLSECHRRPRHVQGQASRAFGGSVARRLHDEAVDAAFCFNDLTALGLISGCLRLGIRPGRDLQIIGFDDIEESASAYPALSTVSCDIQEFGRSVAGILLGWVEQGQKPRPETRTDVSLIVRETSGARTA